ncbi:aryldialkylphosphatase [Lactobacillus sp. ESL0791]|uniref:phosphotriesterase family protein n=1 Tax=Lactobacillus sp. ESL0791 TaxID=2983234 RepID=UPI0023F9AC81|nr:aryldialkylphosphatase [Lactobacillus sp. ESL0791]MDF7638013.1 aryldialkylphosphatase [Lactobacillus sp. ESL0791]
MVNTNKKINTVNGKISVNSMGITYIHEHLYVVPNELPKYYDYTLDDIDKNIAEAVSFKDAGGNTIVDLTPINYGRSPLLLKKIASSAGINVAFVTGFHKQEFQPSWIKDMTDADIYNFLTNEITAGVTSQHLLPAGMKCGTSYNNITDDEKRIIIIESKVQNDLHIPIITHCDQGTMGLEQLALFEKNNADLSHICLSHVDLMENEKYIEQICQTGASVCFDHIGRDLDNHDELKVQMIVKLVQNGYADQICLSGDMGRKKYFVSYGGKPGLKYILTTLKEELLKYISEEDFIKMVKDNPQRILTW